MVIEISVSSHYFHYGYKFQRQLGIKRNINLRFHKRELGLIGYFEGKV